MGWRTKSFKEGILDRSPCTPVRLNHQLCWLKQVQISGLLVTFLTVWQHNLVDRLNSFIWPVIFKGYWQIGELIHFEDSKLVKVWDLGLSRIRQMILKFWGRKGWSKRDACFHPDSVESSCWMCIFPISQTFFWLWRRCLSGKKRDKLFVDHK